MEHLDQARLQALLRSQEGQKLLALLQRDSGTALQQAAAAAKAGDYAKAQAILKPVLEGTDTAEAAKGLWNKLG